MVLVILGQLAYGINNDEVSLTGAQHRHSHTRIRSDQFVFGAKAF